MLSKLQANRLKYQPSFPEILQDLVNLKVEAAEEIEIKASIHSLFSHLSTRLVSFSKGNATPNKRYKVGILFSGGPAAGGHNVIVGLFEALQQLHPESQLIGFLGGAAGLIDNNYKLLDKILIDAYRNQGGFDLLGTGRTKIESEEHFTKSLATVVHHQLDGLIIVGGDDSNTNAAFLAEYFLANDVQTSVVGIPKTIDGDLKNRWVEISFGFDSAAKTYSESIGNVLRDALSQAKHYFFIKVMGRTASHLVLECALQTQPNLALISEELAVQQTTFSELVQQIADLIIERSGINKDYGVILIPEGIIEFIPEIKQLIGELNTQTDLAKLTTASTATLQSLPAYVQKQLLLDRDPHGNIQVSKVETERLLMEAVAAILKNNPQYKGKFSAQPLFCGYEGRSCLPSNFDCNYCYSLGLTAALLIKHRLTGYMAAIGNLASSIDRWEPRAIPLVAMMEQIQVKGKLKSVVHKELVNLQSAPFQAFKLVRENWRLHDQYRYPGPIQFFGEPSICNAITETLDLENSCPAPTDQV